MGALLITGMVTFIAAYHYMRIFNSWTESYSYSTAALNPVLTGKPFNDAYRYMDWLLTVPLLLMEIVLVMNVPENEVVSKCVKLGVSSGLMIILGYPGELLTEADELAGRWVSGSSDDSLLLRRLHAPHRPPRRHQLRDRRGHQVEDQDGADRHRRLLAHLPHRLHHPHDGRHR